MSTRRYILKRLLLTVPILIGVTAITFLMVHLQPGDAVDVLIPLGANPSEEAIQQLREQHHLDKPVYVQYFLWLRDAAAFDFGISIQRGSPVSDAIMTRLPYTLLLGIATPNFWLGLVLLFIFGVELGWFATIPPSDVSVLDPALLKYMILPAVTLGTASSALLMRIMRSSMIEELNKEYVRMARAKGLSERKVIIKHVTRNSLISVVTVAALQIAFIVDGAVVIEQVFSMRGVGRLILQAIFQRDFPVIQAGVLMIGVAIVFANLAADVIYSYLDPRIRY